jgi:hypothetical protein
MNNIFFFFPAPVGVPDLARAVLVVDPKPAKDDIRLKQSDRDIVPACMIESILIPRVERPRAPRNIRPMRQSSRR